MNEQIKKLDAVKGLLNTKGVCVRLRDKNDLRERYSIRQNGSNAFERTDVAVMYGMVVVTSYNSQNQQVDNCVISVTKQDVNGKLENKIALLRSQLQGMVSVKSR